MADLSHLSTEQLQAMLGQPQQPAQPSGLSAIPTEQLMAMLQQQDRETYSPVAGEGAMQRGIEGVGAGMSDAALGTGQAMAHAAHSPYAAAGLAAINPGLLLAGLLSNPEATDAAAREKAQIDKPLTDTTAGKVGQIGGKIAATLPAAMSGGGIPATWAQALGLGAVQGGLSAVAEPSTSEDYGLDKAKQVGLGAAFGGATMGLLKGVAPTVGMVKAVAEKLKGALPKASQAAREQAAAQFLRDTAANPEALTRPAEQFVAGSAPTTAEATRDIGLSGLQRTLQSMSPEFNTTVTQMAQGNNAARVSAIRRAFGGADEGVAAEIEGLRDRVTAPILAAARQTQGVNTAPVLNLADRIIRDRAGNRAVTGIVQEVRDNIANVGRTDVAAMHNLRQDINNLLSSRTSGNSDAARAASRELLSLRSALDSQISRAEPRFRQFLRQYGDMSRDADRVRVGVELLNKGSNVLDAHGNQVLSPARFAGAANDLDAVTKAATGFRKATADNTLTQAQRDAVAAVRSDLDRSAGIAQGKAIGSDTMQKAFGSAKVGEQLGMADFLTANPARIFDNVKRYYGNQTLRIVQNAMANPREAARLVSTLPRAQQADALAMLGDDRILKVLRDAAGAATVVGAGNAGARLSK